MPNDIIQGAKHSQIDDIIIIEEESYNRPWTKKHFENDINHPLAFNYVYIQNNKLVGYLFGYLIDDEYHLNKITVKSSHRGKNIGKSLILYCLKKLEYKRVKCILLEVSSLNLIAQKFYKRMNFTYIGSRKDYYSKDENALLYNLRIK